MPTLFYHPGDLTTVQFLVGLFMIGVIWAVPVTIFVYLVTGPHEKDSKPEK